MLFIVIKTKYLSSAAIFFTLLTSGCASSDTSLYSISYPSYETSLFDFNPIVGDRRKLAEYSLDRTFDITTPGDYEGTLLNPANYAEDENAEVFYRPDESELPPEPSDMSEETISFSGHDDTLALLIDSFNVGILSTAEIESLLEVVDSNDDEINHYEATYAETILYHDFLEGPYYGYKNQHKTEIKNVTRYDNAIVHGTGTGHIIYQDGYEQDYALAEQIRATGYKIYEMRDETYPTGSTLARDYKRTSDRITGNFKDALQVGGGGRAKRFIADQTETYTPFVDTESLTFNPAYSFEVTAEKRIDDTILTFSVHIDQHIDSEGEDVYEMELNYEVVIVSGVIDAHHLVQTYWAAL